MTDKEKVQKVQRNGFKGHETYINAHKHFLYDTEYNCDE